MARRMTRNEERWNAWLGLVLLLGIVVEANLLARRFLVSRTDFSEDQLYAISPVTRSLLGRITDHLHVKAYFTGDIQSGDLALAKARLEGVLEEYEALARGRMRVDVVDPQGSSEALLEAGQYGLTPYQSQTIQGIVQVSQPVYLGLLLRYRGREQTIPFVLPSTLESAFSQQLDNLLRERVTVVGWYGASSEKTPDPSGYDRARSILGARHEIRPIQGLESGQPVGDDVDLLIVARPADLHPRAAYEIDQFVQRGGRLLVCVDQVVIEPTSLIVHKIERTGLEDLLQAWGARVSPQNVWDDQKATVRITRRGVLQPISIEYPLFVRLDAKSFDPSLPPVADLQEGMLPWVQPIEPLEPPAGLTRVDLVQSSENAYRVDLLKLVDLDAEHLESQTKANYARGSGRRYPLAIVLSGRFPSPYAKGAPAPWDPLRPEQGRTTSEAVLSAQNDSQVVVFGDADWMRDEYVQGNEKLLANLVDWLVLDDALLALRARTSRERPLRDYYSEELRKRGLEGLGADESLAELDARLRDESAAARAARTRQWQAMLVPVGITLVLVFLAGGAWNWSERRGTRGAS
jgi:ABC-type uncharacterized transport system involved in gliding motility auxiliary subunit